MMAAESANERLSGLPTGPSPTPLHIKFGDLTLPPMAHTMFCVHNRDECRLRPLFRGGPVHLTEARWEELKEVNGTVNRAIIPEPNELGVAAETWLIDPERGDCNDYAVSKRHKLLSRGWPQRTLLLAEVVTVWGKHHLVLVVRTQSGDLVLDNLTAQVRPWPRAPYRWIRIQSPSNPRYWNMIAPRNV
ncbi:transglutaminase-like cysteine peptidase [Bradyrhizobium sp. CCGUVB1N3]|uniref:transglutaminase-like cysteine peptidase n=1 Tax=Bradyrhizobium sp. CCGUVB1N3 TaxID=2949629 RepID=UPI0020B26A18|nr:transglutaminase-like cysteine peptidase [Bradyrhizobium sp. CCGUVB1N3]MCP3474033.1 transglutaminase-like cysteine peptidase [Bradyrhizobium sp. CCGUVB1N3]